MLQVYNYLLESYPMNRKLNNHANKRNELKKIYSSIININKRSPFYKIDLTKENQEYTIGIKEAALTLKAKLSEMVDTESSSFGTRKVYVDNNHVLTAKLTGEDPDVLPDIITFKINNLAKEQINKGKDLLDTSRGLEKGIYEFRAKVSDNTYDLKFNLTDRMVNKEAIKQFSDFINKSVPGITSFVEPGSHPEYSHIVIKSDATGKFGEISFSFEDVQFFHEGVVDFFALNRVEQPAANCKFELGGVSKQTVSNSFTLENALQVSLLMESDQPVSLRILPDSDKILEQVNSVLNTFNGLIRLAKTHTEKFPDHHFRALKLINEMKTSEKTYQNELEAVGIKAGEDGTLSLDEALASQAAEDGGMESLFQRENGFIASILDEAETIAINPMDYLDKIIVTYPGKERAAFSNPYMTSMYSGLFFSSYC
ncbi:MAG TPA: hypothetical protein VN131_01440 [Mobilitalea sp.]|nr:hypothetical protein [Mobilitalea sp.]